MPHCGMPSSANSSMQAEASAADCAAQCSPATARPAVKTASIHRRRITPSVLYPGTPVLLMTTLNDDGSSNISPLSSFWALGNRVVLGLGTQGQGYRNLQLRNECVLNFPSSAQAAQVEAIARATGCNPVPTAKQAMGYVHVRDKFALGGFTAAVSTHVAPMAIAECPLQVEATVMAMHPPGEDDGQGFVIVEGRIRCVHAHEDITVHGTQHIDATRWTPLIYLFRHYLGVSAPVGRNFRAETPMRLPA